MKWFAFETGEWREHSIDRDFPVPPQLAKRLAARHTDISQAYFYAIDVEVIDDADGRPEDLSDFFWVMADMQRFFRAGKLIEAQ